MTNAEAWQKLGDVSAKLTLAYATAANIDSGVNSVLGGTQTAADAYALLNDAQQQIQQFEDSGALPRSDSPFFDDDLLPGLSDSIDHLLANANAAIDQVNKSAGNLSTPNLIFGAIGSLPGVAKNIISEIVSLPKALLGMNLGTILIAVAAIAALGLVMYFFLIRKAA